MLLEAKRAGRTRAEAEVVGENSVVSVEEALRKNSRIFGGFFRTERGGILDRHGRDLEVDLTSVGRLHDFEHFSIEVKSGSTGVFVFLAKTVLKTKGDLIDSMGLGAAVVDYLFSRKRLVIMAGDDLETETRLMEQYRSLRSYLYRRHRKESNKEMLRTAYRKFFGFKEKELMEEAKRIAIARKP